MSASGLRGTVGLCAVCEHVRLIDTRTGSRFYLCGLSAVDPRFPRYPRLPVVRCAGFRPGPEPAEGEPPAEGSRASTDNP